MGCIYRIRNTVNGKFYIGRATNFINRKSVHKYDLRNNKHGSPYLQHAWNKYGEDKFIFEVVEDNVADDQLVTREQYWLDTTKCYDNSIGYNINSDARTGSLPGKLNHFYGRHLSDSAKALISAANKGHKRWLGKHHTQKTKDKLSEQRIGDSHSEEHREKMSKRNMGRILSPEQKLKRAEGKASKKQVNQLSKDGVFIHTWDSIKDACQFVGRSPASMTGALRTGSNCGGFKWQYVNSIDAEPLKQPINQVDDKGNILATFKTISEAAKAMKCSDSGISNCLNGIMFTCCGFKWQYAP